ncbi:CotH kinase family protein, partial [Siphonobacter aquaeclarae]
MKAFRMFCLIWLGAGPGTAISQQVYINEIMASNSRTVSDATGAEEDWFEIYNPNAFSVNIGGYYVTDDASRPTKYRFPTGSAQTIVPANGFILIWASEAPQRGVTHVGFKLSADGETIRLYASDGTTLIDGVTFGPQRPDISYGRQTNGSNTWVYFPTATPGAGNQISAGYPGLAGAPLFSKEAGFYTGGFSLTLSSPENGATIYYTLDGSEPDSANVGGTTFQYKNSYAENPGQSSGPLLNETFRSWKYTTPLSVADRSSSPNKVSVKSSTIHQNPTFYFPSSSVFKATVVRARTYKPGTVSSDIVTKTYFITPDTARFRLPVVAISLPEKSLFHYNTGIYTAGKVFDDFRAANPSFPTGELCMPGNFAQDGEAWERSGNAEFFVGKLPVIGQSVGVRIHGGCTSSVYRKSLRLYSSSDFSYPFFDSRPASLAYKRLVLRNGGNDFRYTILIDDVMQKMAAHLRLTSQAHEPAAVYLNGEYWGVHTLMERYDKYFFERVHGVPADSLDMVTISHGVDVDEGTADQYNLLRNYFQATGSPDLNYLKTLMDTDCFADYQIVEIFGGNTDWPQNNLVMWRKRIAYNPQAGFGDGRWRWALKDMDYCLSMVNDATFNTLEWATSSGTYPDYTRFLRRMLDIPAFRNYFINRFADLLNTAFHTTRTTTLFNAQKAVYQPDMPEHFSRWPGNASYTSWQTNTNAVTTFLQQRPANVRNHIRSKFGLSSNRNLTVNVSDAAQGYVKVNTIDVLPATPGVPANPYPWTGIYFQGVPVTVVAKPNRGYKFQHWKDGATILTTDTTLTLASLTADRTLLAVFVVDSAFNSKPPAYNLVLCDYRFQSWDAAAPAGTYPPNMQFVSMNQDDPGLTAVPADTVKGAYNYSSRTRINGLGSNGIAFINTGNDNTNPGYVPSRLGGALLALRTLGLNQAFVQWTGGTVTPNSRQYRIRLRYRIGDTGPFQDLTDGGGNPVEYVRNTTAGHSQTFGPVALPAALLNQPYVQLLWQYYYTGIGTSGSRDQLRIDDIVVSRDKCESVASGSWQVKTTWSCGRVPSVCDDVVIKNGHVITIANAEARNLQL